MNKLEIYRNNNFELNDAFDQAVMNIHIQHEQNGYKSFVLCGCEAGNGTTTVAINLAAALASSGKNTVLIDGDMRKKNGHKHLNEKTVYGLANYLTDNTDLNKIIYETDLDKLSYIPCGDSIDNPIRSLCSDKMENAIEELNKRFDYIIYDMPAIDIAMDAKVMSVKADACILVSAMNHTSKRGLVAAANTLVDCKANLIGTIINKTDMDEYRRFRKHYDYFESERYAKKGTMAKKGKKLRSIAALLVCAASLFMGGSTVKATGNNNNNNSNNSGSGTAIVELESYEIEEGVLAAGSEVTLNLNFHNISSDNSASRFTLSLASESNMVFPVYGDDNQVYVGTISADETKTVSVPLKISKYFNLDIVDLECRIGYASNGNAMSNEIAIAIPSNTAYMLNASSVTVADTAIVGGKSLININYNNAGGTDITDANLVVEGNIWKDSKVISLGTVAAGRNYLKDFYIRFKESGEQEIKIKLVYTDASGSTCTVDKGTFKVNVRSEEDNSYVRYEANRTLKLVGLAICGISAISILVIVFMYMKKHI